MFNGNAGLDSLSRLKQQYDAIYEQNSSFRESLLVSPYCSKFQKQQSPRQSIRNPVASGLETSLLDYIRPFESEQLNKTETKNKMRKRQPHDYDNRKRTQPDFQERGPDSDKFIQELRGIIRQKDERIQALERTLADMGYRKGAKGQNQTQTQATVSGSPQTNARYRLHVPYNGNSIQSKIEKYEKRSQKSESQKQNYLYLQAQMMNYKKQIRFLTSNNQQLYEQLRKVNEYSEKLKKTLSTTLLYAQDLEQKFVQISQQNQSLHELNQSLLAEKEEMMANYQEEMKLFKKMKKIWEEQNCRGNRDTGQASRSKSKVQRDAYRSKSTRYKGRQ